MSKNKNSVDTATNSNSIQGASRSCTNDEQVVKYGNRHFLRAAESPKGDILYANLRVHKQDMRKDRFDILISCPNGLGMRKIEYTKRLPEEQQDWKNHGKAIDADTLHQLCRFLVENELDVPVSYDVDDMSIQEQFEALLEECKDDDGILPTSGLCDFTTGDLRDLVERYGWKFSDFMLTLKEFSILLTRGDNYRTRLSKKGDEPQKWVYRISTKALEAEIKALQTLQVSSK